MYQISIQLEDIQHYCVQVPTDSHRDGKRVSLVLRTAVHFKWWGNLCGKHFALTLLPNIKLRRYKDTRCLSVLCFIFRGVYFPVLYYNGLSLKGKKNEVA